MRDLPEHELWTLVQEGDGEARKIIMERYANLLHKVALKMVRGLPSHVDADDLVSYGSLGLIRAVDNFDPEMGKPFSTYAVAGIRSRILDELRIIDWAPKSLRRKAKDIERARTALRDRDGREPTDTEVASHLGVDEEHVRDTDLAVKHSTHRSLDEAQFGQTQTWDIAEEAPETDEQALMSMTQSQMVEWLEEKPVTQQVIMCLCYYEGRTLLDISRELGMPEAQVVATHSSLVVELREHILVSIGANPSEDQ